MSTSKPTVSIKKPVNTSVVKSVTISYPPLKSAKGTAFLSHNRQFQMELTPQCYLPDYPAYAATLLASHGLKIYWDDAIAKN
jgi:hypothetical protein